MDERLYNPRKVTCAYVRGIIGHEHMKEHEGIDSDAPPVTILIKNASVDAT
jgi:hypothetical protein